MALICGSSPLARGLHESPFWGGGVRRIIPARAGFTHSSNRGKRARADHPRSRGVYLELRKDAARFRGSSPLARGLLGCGRPHGRDARIIPARAGFTSPHFRSRDRASDHPRSRGVYAPSSARAPSRSGSSPLARGLHGVRARLLGLRGIIPARAGFTSSWGGPLRS